MRTMNDTERLLLVTRVFLDLNGPATAREIVDYIESCPVNIEKKIHVNTIGSLLRGKRYIGKTRTKKNRKNKYYIKK